MMMVLMVVERRWVVVEFVEGDHKVLVLADRAAEQDIRLGIDNRFAVELSF